MVQLASASQIPLESLPFVTSIVLVIAAPSSPQSQPLNIIGGHILSAMIGVLSLSLLGGSGTAAAAAVGIATAVMVLTRTLHPPAGINAFMAVTQHVTWSFVFIPVASGALMLTAFAWLYHRLTLDAEWPSK